MDLFPGTSTVACSLPFGVRGWAVAGRVSVVPFGAAYDLEYQALVPFHYSDRSNEKVAAFAPMVLALAMRGDLNLWMERKEFN